MDDVVIQQSNDGGLRELALFAGAGGGILGGKLLGWRTVCAVERDAYAAQVLAQRQNDGILEPFPIWSDVTTFDGKTWRGRIDVVSGGFPCQDISVAGKGLGIEGARSGMWKQFKRIICEVEPRKVYVENSPALTIRGLGVVLGDLASMGFDAELGVFSCADVGGVHLRERIWIKATNSSCQRCNNSTNNREVRHIHQDEEWNDEENKSERNKWECRSNQDASFNVTDNGSERIKMGIKKKVYRFSRFPWGEDVGRVEDLRNRPDLPEPLVCRINHDVAFGMDRLKAIGNGQVPRVAATAWRILSK